MSPALGELAPISHISQLDQLCNKRLSGFIFFLSLLYFFGSVCVIECQSQSSIVKKYLQDTETSTCIGLDTQEKFVSHFISFPFSPFSHFLAFTCSMKPMYRLLF
jgi:hypothetical protein